MENRSLGRRLDRALLALQLKAQGAAVDPTRDLVSTGKSETSKPPSYEDECGIWLGRAERLVGMMESDVRSLARVPSKWTATDLTSIIRDFEGRDAVYVAYTLGCSYELVCKVRTKLGLQPSTGFRRERPLTSREVPVDSVVPSRTGGTFLIQGEITAEGGNEDV